MANEYGSGNGAECPDRYQHKEHEHMGTDMHLIDSLSYPRMHAIASAISLGIAALSFLTVVISFVVTRMAVRSGGIARLILRGRRKVICAFSGLTGLSGALSI